MRRKLNNIISLLAMLALLHSVASHAQEKDYFPTFDMMEMQEISDTCPLVANNGKSLRLVDYYGKEISDLMKELGQAEYTSSYLYYGIYPYSGFGDIYGIMDLYHEREVAVKIYEWPESSIFVLCIKNGKKFDYPLELFRFHPRHSYIGTVPLEKWIATESGDDGWLVLSWRNESRSDIDELEHFSYGSPEKSHDQSVEFYDLEFMSDFSLDSFAYFYFQTLTLRDFMPKPYCDKCLAEFAGMSYSEFTDICGHPDFEQEMESGNIIPPKGFLHILWPLHELLSCRDNWPVKVCTYEKNGYQMMICFVRKSDSWGLVYADIAPNDYFYIEF